MSEAEKDKMHPMLVQIQATLVRSEGIKPERAGTDLNHEAEKRKWDGGADDQGPCERGYDRLCFKEGLANGKLSLCRQLPKEAKRPVFREDLHTTRSLYFKRLIIKSAQR